MTQTGDMLKQLKSGESTPQQTDNEPQTQTGQMMKQVDWGYLQTRRNVRALANPKDDPWDARMFFLLKHYTDAEDWQGEEGFAPKAMLDPRFQALSKPKQKMLTSFVMPGFRKLPSRAKTAFLGRARRQHENTADFPEVYRIFDQFDFPEWDLPRSRQEERAWYDAAWRAADRASSQVFESLATTRDKLVEGLYGTKEPFNLAQYGGMPTPGKASLSAGTFEPGETHTVLETEYWKRHAQAPYLQPKGKRARPRDTWEKMKDPARWAAVLTNTTLIAPGAIAATSMGGFYGGWAFMGALEAGNAYKRVKERGGSELNARLQMVSTGLINGLLEYAPIDILLRKMSRPAINAVKGSLRRQLAYLLKSSFHQAGVEGAQESGQQFVQNLIQKLGGTRQNIGDCSEIIEAGIFGSGAGMFMGAGGSVVGQATGGIDVSQIERARTFPTVEEWTPPSERIETIIAEAETEAEAAAEQEEVDVTDEGTQQQREMRALGQQVAQEEAAGLDTSYVEEEYGADVHQNPAFREGQQAVQQPETETQVEPQGEPEGKALATPAAHALAKEHDVNIRSIEGTGARGYVTKSDVQQAVEGEGETGPVQPGMEVEVTDVPEASAADVGDTGTIMGAWGEAGKQWWIETDAGAIVLSSENFRPTGERIDITETITGEDNQRRVQEALGDDGDPVYQGDTQLRVVWGPEQDVLHTTNLQELNLEGEDARGVHVTGDPEYWIDQLAEDYGRSPENAKVIEIRPQQGDRVIEDPQQIEGQVAGDLDRSAAVLVTGRETLKRGRDFVYEGEQFTEDVGEATVPEPGEAVEPEATAEQVDVQENVEEATEQAEAEGPRLELIRRRAEQMPQREQTEEETEEPATLSRSQRRRLRRKATRVAGMAQAAERARTQAPTETEPTAQQLERTEEGAEVNTAEIGYRVQQAEEEAQPQLYGKSTYVKGLGGPEDIAPVRAREAELVESARQTIASLGPEQALEWVQEEPDNPGLPESEWETYTRSVETLASSIAEAPESQLAEMAAKAREEGEETEEADLQTEPEAGDLDTLSPEEVPETEAPEIDETNPAENTDPEEWIEQKVRTWDAEDAREFLDAYWSGDTDRMEAMTRDLDLSQVLKEGTWRAFAHELEQEHGFDTRNDRVMPEPNEGVREELNDAEDRWEDGERYLHGGFPFFPQQNSENQQEAEDAQENLSGEAEEFSGALDRMIGTDIPDSLRDKLSSFWENTKRAGRELRTEVVDQSGNVKATLLNSDSYAAQRAVMWHELTMGSSEAGIARFQKARDRVWGDLRGPGENRLFAKLLHAYRTIEVTQVQQERGVAIEHPEGVSEAGARKFIEGVQQRLSNEHWQRFEGALDSYWTEWQKVLDRQYEAGLLEERGYKWLSNNHQHYLPRRFLHHLDPDSVNQDVSVASSGIQPLKGGSNQDLMADPATLLAQGLVRTEARITNNQAAKQALHVAQEESQPDILRPAQIVRYNQDGEPVYAPAPNGWQRMSAMVDGQRQSFLMEQEMANEWNRVKRGAPNNVATQALQWMGPKPVKALATGYNPAFLLTNVPQDAGLIWLGTQEYSSHLPVAMGQGLTDSAQVAWDVVTRSGRVQQFFEEGGGMRFLQHQGSFSRMLDRSGQHLHRRGLDTLAQAAEWLGETSELWTRLALRERAMKNGYSSREATWIARRYLDFSLGGRMIKVLDRFAMPYMNAATQASRTFARAMKEHPIKTSYKIAQLSMTGAAVAAGSIYVNPAAWKRVSDNIKARYFVFTLPSWLSKYKDSQGRTRFYTLAIRKPPAIRPFMAATEGAVEWYMTGRLPSERIERGTQEALEMVPGPTLPPAMDAALGYATNTNFWTWDRIWRGEDVEAEQEYRKPETHPLWRHVGDTLGMSPMRLQYAASQIAPAYNPFVRIASLGSRMAFPGVDNDAKGVLRRAFHEGVPMFRRMARPSSPAPVQDYRVQEEFRRKDRTESLKQSRDFLYLLNSGAGRDRILEFIRDLPQHDQQRYIRKWKTKRILERQGGPQYLVDTILQAKGLSPEARANWLWYKSHEIPQDQRRQFRKMIFSDAAGLASERFKRQWLKMRRHNEEGRLIEVE